MTFDLSWSQGVAELAGATDRAAFRTVGARAVAPRLRPVGGPSAVVDAELLRDLRGIDLRLAALGFEPKSGLRS